MNAATVRDESSGSEGQAAKILVATLKSMSLIFKTAGEPPRGSEH